MKNCSWKLWTRVYEMPLSRGTLFWAYKGRKYIAVDVRGEAHVVMFTTLFLVLKRRIGSGSYYEIDLLLASLLLLFVIYAN